MTLAALHLFHNSIDLHNLTGQGQGELGLAAVPSPSASSTACPTSPHSTLAERGGRDGRASLGGRQVRLGVQQKRAESKVPGRPRASGGRGTPQKLIAGAAPSEGAPAEPRSKP